MTRRLALQLAGATPLLACANAAVQPKVGPPRARRFAICNETFPRASFAEACRLARATGYEGVEVMPATLSSDPAGLGASERAGLRGDMRRAGVAFVGLHAVLSAPAGLHLTTADAEVRARSWAYLQRLVELCADLGGGVFVLGSGKQRSAPAGVVRAEATARLVDGLATVAPRAAALDVRILLEPLAPAFSNLVNTLDEAMAVVRQVGANVGARVGASSLATMFDTHNTIAETQPHDEVIRRHAAHIGHVHVNELDGRHPGTGRYDFGRVLGALDAVGYQGWISLEVFDFRPDGRTVAEQAMRYLRALVAQPLARS
jgi:sugar phosphate isomerase/epimerase